MLAAQRVEVLPRIFPAFPRRALLLAPLWGLGGCRQEPELPTLGQVPAFSLLSQDKQRVEAASLRGSVWVAAFMFTRCPTICPRITRRMHALQTRASEQKISLRLLSISVDPENDTPEVLRDYARRFGADTRSWSFVTGEFASIQKIAVDGFKLALEGRADAKAADFGILHGSHLVLVDRDLHIRGYYRTDDDQAMAALLSDAARLAR